MSTATFPSRETSICDLSQRPINSDPFPHVVHEQFIRPEIYRRLCDSFPSCPPKAGPTGFSLYWGDPGYEQLLAAEPAWRQLFETFHSQAFVDWGAAQFASVWSADDCIIDPRNGRFVSYREDSIDKERATLRQVIHEPDELWVRMDIHQGRLKYDRPIHLDHGRRVLSLLIYMSDHTENEMTGGELLLHGNVQKSSPTTRAGERVDQSTVSRITPRHNLMVAFPCSARSYHSVTPITTQRAPRNHVQVHISSSVDIWPRPSIPRWRQLAGSLKRRITK
jgi:hypothetical protein